MLITHIGGLRTQLITTPEPPSRMQTEGLGWVSLALTAVSDPKHYKTIDL